MSTKPKLELAVDNTKEKEEEDSFDMEIAEANKNIVLNYLYDELSTDDVYFTASCLYLFTECADILASRGYPKYWLVEELVQAITDLEDNDGDDKPTLTLV